MSDLTKVRLVLLLGSGGRETALAHALTRENHANAEIVEKIVAESKTEITALDRKYAIPPEVTIVFVAPGNPQTREMILGCRNLPEMDVNDHVTLKQFCETVKIDLVVVGPEGPLEAGIADHLSPIPVFGPKMLPARLETSKAFAKSVMDSLSLPTARWEKFTDADEAASFVQKTDFKGIVVKASGLAKGKGVVVANDKQEAEVAARGMLSGNTFGAAGEEIVIEERLCGYEVSCHALCDGKDFIFLPPSQDHKRRFDGDLGGQTGGMGAVASGFRRDDAGKNACWLLTKEQEELVKWEIVDPILTRLREEKTPFVGVFYVGLMVDPEDESVKILEFNVRFGDPEAQVILPLLDFDLFSALKRCVDGTLGEMAPVQFHQRYSVGVVVCSGGYPDAVDDGCLLTWDQVGEDEIKELEKKNISVLPFLAGAKHDSNIPCNPRVMSHLLSTTALTTKGGRILTSVVTAPSLTTAMECAESMASKFHFQGASYRKDIGQSALRVRDEKWASVKRNSNNNNNNNDYASAGVNLQAGRELVDRIKSISASTKRAGCPEAGSSNIGQFGAFFDPRLAGYEDPLLVSGTDGVGTKLQLARSVNTKQSRRAVGVDLVAMCVNDVLCHGAEPLFFLDYFACGKLAVDEAEDVIEGIGEGCRRANCALVGGETAEMPGFYEAGKFDLAGFSVGAVEKGSALPNLHRMKESDVLIGVHSSGLHSNGFSLVRKVLDDKKIDLSSPCPWNEELTLGEDLLTPTDIYVDAVLPLIRRRREGSPNEASASSKEQKPESLVKACVHVTGGGIPENLSRVLPAKLDAMVDCGSWKLPEVFKWLATVGMIRPEDMMQTFNCGIGFILVAGKGEADSVIEKLAVTGRTACVIGSVVQTEVGSGGGRVNLENLDSLFAEVHHCPLSKIDPSLASTNGEVNGLVAREKKERSILRKLKGSFMERRKRVAVLISGEGTNLQALLDHTQPARQVALRESRRIREVEKKKMKAFSSSSSPCSSKKRPAMKVESTFGKIKLENVEKGEKSEKEEDEEVGKKDGGKERDEEQEREEEGDEKKDAEKEKNENEGEAEDDLEDDKEEEEEEDRIDYAELSLADIVCVVSNRPSARGLKRAAKSGIPRKVIDHKDFDSRRQFEKEITEFLKSLKVDYICLAGFMRILSADFVEEWRGRILNVHPSLLPSFKGCHAHRDALAAGVKVSGCTVHFVVPEVDAGQIVVQKTVEIGEGETEETLQEKVKEVERIAFPEALERVVRGEVKMDRWMDE